MGPASPSRTGACSTESAATSGTWAEVKAQAATILGIQLADTDITAVPLLLTDEYGRFLRGANGFPQLVQDATATVVEGNPAAPVTTCRLGEDRSLVPG